MALTIHLPKKDEETMPPMIADRRLYLSADRERVIEEGETGAAFLLAGPNGTIPPAEVKRLGLTESDGRVVVANTERIARHKDPPLEGEDDVPPTEKKKRKKPADKAKRRPKDK